ncbi:MAG: DNA polymerase III subunit gamma/tau [Hyphomicrobiales bacterium]|nr:DNA polymerase III subunit gamma/tau [Hyphomicrobiales bacterium]
MASSLEDNKPVSNYRVIARKYRPHNFDDLIGQEPMVRTLSNAFETGRIAQAFMLTGVRGVGKTTTARILARALNYKSPTVDKPSVELSQMGENCQAIMDGNHLDIIEMDAASHTGIDDIRDLIESAQYKPSSARYKVYIIDEVHMLSRNAFNGLLKTLEEPPEHLKFIFATTEIRKVPVTILSRCQRFDLRRIGSDVMASHLTSISEKEGVEIDANALAMIVRASEGSVRDAQSLLDQAIAHSARSNDDSTSDIIKIEGDSVRAMLGLADRMRVIDLFEYLMKGEIAACLGELRDQFDVGAEPGVVLSDLADFVHFVTRLKYVPAASEDPAISESESKRGLEFATTLSVRVLGRAWQILVKGIEEVNASERPLMAADMVLVRLAHAANLPTPDEVIHSIGKGGNTNPGTVGGKSAPVEGDSPGGSASVSGGVISAVAGTSSLSVPRMTGTGAPHLAIVPNSTQVQPVVSETPQVVLNKFEELIFLAEDKRDLSIKTGLRRNIRLVKFEDGRIECSLTGNPRPGFINELHQKLKLWTGKRWNIVISRESGAPSLEEVERAEESNKLDMASADPVVSAILAKFPGSRVIDVRIRENDNSQSEQREESDGVDEFFD